MGQKEHMDGHKYSSNLGDIKCAETVATIGAFLSHNPDEWQVYNKRSKYKMHIYKQTRVIQEEPMVIIISANHHLYGLVLHHMFYFKSLVLL